jgi:hypothetical protein
MKTVVESGAVNVIGSKIVSVVSFLQEEIAKAIRAIVRRENVIFFIVFFERQIKNI